MKKTFTININGSIFHIEEDAYEVLQKYLVNLKNHFGNSEEGKEILDDIEARIAEICSSKSEDGCPLRFAKGNCMTANDNNKLNKSFKNFDTSAEYIDYISGTLLPSIQLNDSSLVANTASAFGELDGNGDLLASAVHEYLLDTLSWFYILVYCIYFQDIIIHTDFF